MIIAASQGLQTACSGSYDDNVLLYNFETINWIQCICYFGLSVVLSLKGLLLLTF